MFYLFCYIWTFYILFKSRLFGIRKFFQAAEMYEICEKYVDTSFYGLLLSQCKCQITFNISLIFPLH